MRRTALLLLASGLALVACLTFGWYMFDRPNVLQVAVVRDSPDQAIFAAANVSFGREREGVRLHPLLVDTLADSAAALEDGRADLAVVRSDIALPPSGQVVLVMRHDAGIIVVPGGSPIRVVEDLRGHRIGILRNVATTGDANRTLLETILSQYDVAPQDVTTVGVDATDLVKALIDGRIEAVLLFGVPGTKPLLDAVSAVGEAGRGPPVFIPVTEAKGIAQRSPAFESTEIVRGVFGGAVPKPAASFETVGVATRLVARNTLGLDVVSSLTRLLLDARPALARTVPLANRIEAPDADRGAALAVHPGTLAYLGDDEQTFFDKYSDAIYIGAMLLSVLGSAAAALAGRFQRHNGIDVNAHFVELHGLIEAVRAAPDLLEVDRLERDADQLLARTLGPQAVGQLDASRIAAFGVIFDHVRGALAERRRALEAALRLPFEPRVIGEAGP